MTFLDLAINSTWRHSDYGTIFISYSKDINWPFFSFFFLGKHETTGFRHRRKFMSTTFSSIKEKEVNNLFRQRSEWIPSGPVSSSVAISLRSREFDSHRFHALAAFHVKNRYIIFFRAVVFWLSFAYVILYR